MKQFEMFLNHHELANKSDAFREGVECAFEQIETNLVRLSFSGLAEMLRDCYGRSQKNLEYAKSEDAAEFQRGYQAVCKHFLKNS
jgi:hypothetical protein